MSKILYVSNNSQEILPFIEFANCYDVNIEISDDINDAIAIAKKISPSAIIFSLAIDSETEEKLPVLLAHTQYSAMINQKKIPKAITKLFSQIIPKSLSLEDLKTILCKINITTTPSIKAKTNKANTANEDDGFCGIIGNSNPMKHVYKMIEKVGPTDATVFIIGNSGTGKELAAKAIHDCSKRASKNYLAVNCGAISSELICSELFGHEKGSFTGAFDNHKGYFEQADGGTIFLDEITETSLDFQVKLLRVLETGKIIPVGGKRVIDVDVRIVASTNRCPLEAIEAGVLREDLFYRLCVFPLQLPILKDRKNDIILLAKYFLKVFNEHEQKNVKISKEALDVLPTFPFHGNVRELKNLIYRAFILADDVITPELLVSFEEHSLFSDSKSHSSLDDNNFYNYKAEFKVNAPSRISNMRN